MHVRGNARGLGTYVQTNRSITLHHRLHFITVARSGEHDGDRVEGVRAIGRKSGGGMGHCGRGWEAGSREGQEGDDMVNMAEHLSFATQAIAGN